MGERRRHIATLEVALAMSDPGPADHLSEQTSKQIHELWSLYVADSADESCVTLDEYLNVTDRVDKYLAAFNPRGESGESEQGKRERKETMFNEELADQHGMLTLEGLQIFYTKYYELQLRKSQDEATAMQEATEDVYETLKCQIEELTKMKQHERENDQKAPTGSTTASQVDSSEKNRASQLHLLNELDSDEKKRRITSGDAGSVCSDSASTAHESSQASAEYDTASANELSDDEMISDRKNASAAESEDEMDFDFGCCCARKPKTEPKSSAFTKQ